MVQGRVHGNLKLKAESSSSIRGLEGRKVTLIGGRMGTS